MKKYTRKAVIVVMIAFVLMNVVAALHAWKFTHLQIGVTRTKEPSELGFGEKVKTLVSGVSLPRRVATTVPPEAIPVSIQRRLKLSCWWMPASVAAPKGSIALFHGYGGEKSAMVDKARILNSMGYNALLVDFGGSGTSEGDEVTIGYKEAEDVKVAVNWLQQNGEQNITLLGTSMGAAAVLRAQSLYQLPVKSIIAECPFGSMRQTVYNRFRNMGVPAFPMADLLMFWGGVETGFNAFSHNPETYALKVSCPVLLLYGAKDINVNMEETQAIYANLPGTKKLVIYPEAGHESYLHQYQTQWISDVGSFLGGL